MDNDSSKNKLVNRVIFCIFIWLIFFVGTITFLTPKPAIFSFRDEDDLKCDSKEQCLGMAKARSKWEWENQRQAFEYAERWSQLVGFSILPLRYEISLENRSYNQVKTTGWAGEKRQLPAKVFCGDPPMDVEANSLMVLKNNLKLEDVYSKVETLLEEFNGCSFDLLQMNQSIQNSLDVDKLVVSPNESVILSSEQKFNFPIKLDKLSHLFIAVQGFLLLPALLLIPKPIVRFVSRGWLFFKE